VARSVDPIERLILELARLPGIGRRTASRLAYFLLKGMSGKGAGQPSLAVDLAEALLCVAREVRLCAVCGNFCAGETCRLCSDARRDPHTLCVVEGIADLLAIEGSGSFSGRYHVLHGALAPLDGIGPEELRLDVLAARVREGDFSEVIVATNNDVEGEATALYLTRLLRPHLKGERPKISRLASGVPIGGELEFLDQATLGRALAERREI
jgi:recombination protein RecR